MSNGLANNSKKSTWIYTIFCIQTSTWLLNAVVIASVLHTLSVFFEPSEQCMAHWLFRLYQWSVVVLYAADIALKMSYEGVKVSGFMCLCAEVGHWSQENPRSSICLS